MADARILLVEDDDLNQRLVRTVLARSGDPVLRSACLVQAASLAEARAALATSAVDVVLLDLNLPDGHGLSLAAEVQRTGSGGPAMRACLCGPRQLDAAACPCPAHLQRALLPVSAGHGYCGGRAGGSPRRSTSRRSSRTSSGTCPPAVQSAQRIPTKLPIPVYMNAMTSGS